MHPLFLAMMVSFVAGVIAYVIVKIWLAPIWRYYSAKRRISSCMKRIVSRDDYDADIDDKELMKEIGQCASDLSSCQNDFPLWYNIILKYRGESPSEAVRHIMKLTNTRKKEHALNRVEKIKNSLKMK